MAAVDIYLNETTRHADVILPPTTALEREQYDLVFHTLAVRNTARFTPPALEKADGATGQRMYLEMMTAHHKGAIAMAQTEISDGENPEAIELAKEIVATQQQEITVMADLLAKL